MILDDGGDVSQHRPLVPLTGTLARSAADRRVMTASRRCCGVSIQVEAFRNVRGRDPDGVARSLDAI